MLKGDQREEMRSKEISGPPLQCVCFDLGDMRQQLTEYCWYISTTFDI